MDLSYWIDLDKTLLLALNSNNSLFWDGVMWTVTSTSTWIPVILVLLFVVFKNNRWNESLLIIVMIALTITFADQFASGFCKPYFARLRPHCDPEIMDMVHTINGHSCGRYGFISSHAANTFGVAVFVSLLVKNWGLTAFLLSWAAIPSYSRIYMGVHFPGDIITGALAGSLIAFFNYLIYSFIKKKFIHTHPQYISSQYSKSGYSLADIRLLELALILTYFYAIIYGMIVAKTSFF